MKYILDFMYHGEVNVAQEELDKFLEVAETLKIKGLTQGSNGSRAAKRSAASTVSSSPSPGEPRKKPKMHSAVTPSTPSSAPKTEAEVSVKTETGPSVPVGAEDFEESVGGEDDYGEQPFCTITNISSGVIIPFFPRIGIGIADHLNSKSGFISSYL